MKTTEFRTRRILEVASTVVAMPDVQPGFPAWDGNTDTTWCNRALYRMIEMLGGKAHKLVEPRGISWTNANEMVRQARKNFERVISGQIAQSRANVGDLIIAMSFNERGSGHVALVVPDTESFVESNGPRIGQAGARNGIMTTRQGFGSYFPIVEYYVVPYDGFCGA